MPRLCPLSSLACSRQAAQVVSWRSWLQHVVTCSWRTHDAASWLWAGHLTHLLPNAHCCAALQGAGGGPGATAARHCGRRSHAQVHDWRVRSAQRARPASLGCALPLHGPLTAAPCRRASACAGALSLTMAAVLDQHHTADNSASAGPHRPPSLAGAVLMSLRHLPAGMHMLTRAALAQA